MNGQPLPNGRQLKIEPGDFLEKILNVENDARLERQRTALMKLATLPSIKTFEQYDFAFASGAPRAQIQELAALTFIERAENVVLLVEVELARAIWRKPWPTVLSWRASRRDSSQRQT